MRIRLKRLFDYFIALVLIAGACGILFSFYGMLIFQGAFGNETTREEAIENFRRNEKTIDRLVMLINATKPKNKDLVFSFDRKNDWFDLSLTAADGIIDDNHPVIRWTNLTLNSPRTDSMLVTLGWKKETLEVLMYLLEKSGCKYVMTGKRTQLQYGESGWCGIEYHFYEAAIPEMTRCPIGDQNILRKNVALIVQCAP